ncbi:ABC transporter ATP-binding protein [Bacillus salitolerans]|uniref:ABC transporter ATP-binding protein n=1 Tax=Bacillus salitolerans TaxID=1437434 RepID=A0ABW4LVR9_9BACI
MHLLDVDIHRAGYSLHKHTLQEIKFSIKAGEIVGLIGPNGAGKSTTTQAILGVLPSVVGNIQLHSGSEQIGYIPEQPLYYEGLTLWEHLELAATAYDIQENILNSRANHLLKEFRMEHAIHAYPSTFSKGMKQKLMIILAFFIKPKLFVVDEPFIGLDPGATKRLILKLEEEKKNGSGILLSTHVLDTAEKICDRFILVFQGRILSSGTLEEIQDYAGLKNGSLLDCFYEIIEGHEYAGV